jgi:hypothetical protein
MEMDVCANLFLPLRRGEPYLVVASALPAIQSASIRKELRASAMASSLEEARAMRLHLAARVAQMIRNLGAVVRDTHLHELA